MKVRKLSKENVHLLREHIDKAMAAVGKRWDLTIESGTIRYNPDGSNFRCRVEGNTPVEKGSAKVASRQRGYEEAWKVSLKRKLAGFKDGDLFKIYKMRNEEFRITGWNNSATVYKVLSERVRDKKLFKANPKVVKEALDAGN